MVMFGIGGVTCMLCLSTGMKVPASVVLDICAWHPGRAWAQQVFGAEAVDNSSSRARWAGES